MSWTYGIEMYPRKKHLRGIIGMRRGKFEAGRNRSSGGAAYNHLEQQSGRKPQQSRKKKKTKIWPFVVGALAVVALAAGIFTAVSFRDDGKIFDNVYACGVNLGGMTQQEAEQALEQAVGDSYETTDLVIKMAEDGKELVFKPADTKVQFDAQAAAEAAYLYGRDGSIFAKARARSAAKLTDHVIDPADYLTMDEQYVQGVVDEEAATGSEMTPTKVEKKTEQRDVEETREDGSTETVNKDVQLLVITLGTSKRDFTAEDLRKAIDDAYAAHTFEAEFTYDFEAPEPVDLDALYKEYCTEPKDASYDEKTFEITPEVVGYGFDKEDVQKQLDEAKEGDEIVIELGELAPEITEEKLRASLFADVLASYDSPHTWINDRTHNLELACEAIDGTVLMPGQTFSFNETVGERTKEKGYREAIVYVSGESVPQRGGGVCQVASTIYYCALMADLDIVTRAPHMYFVTYVPAGMDATVYWGSQDFKFRNSTEYPLRIDASVSDGYVHIKLVGTETKDYTVKMTYDIVSTMDWKTVEKEITDGSYANGEVITTPYTGYKVITYMHKYDKNGKEISVEQVAVSTYNKRDKVVAVVKKPEESTEPTEPPTSSSETTPPPTETTAAPTEPTTPPTEPAPDPTEAG